MMKDKELLKHIESIIINVNQFNWIKNDIDKTMVINDVFMNIWNKINEGKISKNIEDIKDYIFITAKNQCLLFYRNEKKHLNNCEMHNLKSKDTFNSHRSYDTIIDEITSEIEDNEAREVIKLKIIGYDNDEINNLTNINTNNVRKIINKFKSNKPLNIRKHKYELISEKDKFKFKTMQEIADYFDVSRQYVCECFNNNRKIRKFTIKKVA